jgi:beta-lactamase regulating signal transducer with metallopeptidase domain
VRVFFVIAAPVTWLTILQTWTPLLWALGVLLFSARLLYACRRVSILKRQGHPAAPSILAQVSRLSQQMRIDRPVRVLVSTLADGPSVAGWIRPVILLPAATLLGLTPDQLESVLAHELAHIRRHDYLVNLIQMTIETLWFYHPAAWWISTRVRRERELCCDDLAVATCGDALCYARALAALERIRAEQPLAPELALGARDGGLLFRIQRLLGITPRETHWSRIPAFAAIILAITCFASNVNWARAQAPSPRPAPVTAAPQQQPPAPVPAGQPDNPFGIILPPVPISADSWIRFSTPDTRPLSERSASYRFGGELFYLSQGVDIDNLPWLQAATQGVRRDASPGSVREAAQADDARGIPTWTLTVVNISGLSDARRNELLSLLPIHESYRVSHERMDAAAQAIHDFDRTLRYSFLTAWDGHAELQITAQ